MRKLLLTLLPILCFAQPKFFENEIPPRPWVHIEFQQPEEIKEFVYDTWGETVLTRNLIHLIHIESSFNIYAKNSLSSAIGLGQITKGTAIECGFSYEEISLNPVANIFCTYVYFKRALQKASGNFETAKFLYQNGIYYLENQKRN